MLRKLARPALTMLAALSLLVMGGPAQAVTGGQPDGNRHPYVGAFFQAGRFGCTGELVSPTKVVSAAHCFEFNVTPPVTFTLDPNPSASSTYYPVTSWQPMPGYSTNTDPTHFSWPRYHNDLLVATLGQPVEGVTPVSLPTQGYVDTLNLRTQTFTLVGYGATVIQGGNPQGSGSRMFANASAKRGQSVSVSNEYLLVSGMGSSTGGCFGDSGGAVLVGNTLVAVIVGGNGLCEGWTYATRVDTQAALDFIRSQL
jgi:trypsin